MTKICVSITEENVKKAMDKINSIKNSDLVELRIDFIKDIDEKKLEKLLSIKKLPTIITCRSKSQGGKIEENGKKRISLLKKAIKLKSDFIDIEAETDEDTINDIIKNKKKSKIIISHHDFSGTPSLDELEKIYKKINSYSPDLIKIVTTANFINDCFTIFRLLKGKNNLIALCMGIKGQITRILAPKFGSVITFASMEKGKESAPGQITINELNEYNFDRINPNTKLLGVIGEHGENSKSKFMHNANFKKLKLDFVYVPLKVSAEELELFMKYFKEFNFKGAAVTVPHKETIVKHINVLDETAKKISATNTLVNENDFITGYNTDYFGAVEALKEKTELENKKVLVIGAGGAARAIIFGLKKENAIVTLINRTDKKANSMADEFNISSDKFESMDQLLKQSDIIINSTSVGMSPNKEECIVEDLPEKKIVMDIVYTPIGTKLIKLAKKKNCITITGERMLIHQAIGQFEKWTGVKPRFEDMENALLKHIDIKTKGDK